MAESNSKMGTELRLCVVDGKIGYFHIWEQYSAVIPPSPMLGGHSGGIDSEAFGIVEFPDGVRRVPPTKINFCDEHNNFLFAMQTSFDKNSRSPEDILKKRGKKA